ncbi:MAG: nitroreductase family protein [Desulfuromonadales bacterium]|nr:nitroreductase family protein [Desulfuromonadales bacterium]
MLKFSIDKQKCTKCGFCANDCLAGIINMNTAYPAIAAKQEVSCFKCQHCLAICPTGAISILGKNPENSQPLKENLPDPDRIETLIKGRRSVRQYRDENLAPELIQRLLDVAWHAPTGRNARRVMFSVINDKEAMARFREEAMQGLMRVVRENRLPAGMKFVAELVSLWEEHRVDTVFRGAPHLIVASAPKVGATPEADCLIALSYFELFAQSLGVGTVWGGIAKLTFNDLVPELRKTLGIPDKHLIGYAMAFGKPAVIYHRTVEQEKASIVYVVK